MKNMRRTRNKACVRPGAVPTKEVGGMIRRIINVAGVNSSTLANACVMAESQMARLGRHRTGCVRNETLIPIKRVETLVKAASEALPAGGVSDWLNTPNPYLDDIPPILHARSEEELAKSLSLLASLQYGFPA